MIHDIFSRYTVPMHLIINAIDSLIPFVLDMKDNLAKLIFMQHSPRWLLVACFKKVLFHLMF